MKVSAINDNVANICLQILKGKFVVTISRCITMTNLIGQTTLYRKFMITIYQHKSVIQNILQVNDIEVYLPPKPLSKLLVQLNHKECQLVTIISLEKSLT